MDAPIKVREVGKIKASVLKRFGRNQRRAALVAPRAGQPMGVRRFKTWEDVDACRKTKSQRS